MKFITRILLLITLFLTACKATKNKRVITTKKDERKSKSKDTKTPVEVITKVEETSSNSKADNIISYAESFKGVKYKYGGTTKAGMDCSGLVHTAFKSEDEILPRTSSQMSKKGQWIDLKEVEKGDLLFFATKKNSRDVTHVGLVVSANSGKIEFIHSSSSKGVITSLLSERYWYHAFVQARRVL